MKIATITFHKAINYGAILQCYALQKAINNLGFDSEVLNYDCKMISAGYMLIRTDSKIGFVKSLIRLPYYYHRQRKYNNFIKKYIAISREYDHRDLVNVANNYEAIITGSDQVWNYNLTGSDSTYFLDFVQEQRKRLSYAASFGIKEVPKQYLEFYHRNIDAMGHISVRENTARRMVAEICGRNADVVLDPVFLQCADDWRRIMPQNREKNYIFVYMPGEKTLKAARLLAKKKKLKVIYCAYDYSLRNIRDNIGDVRLSLGPDEFLSLINGADYVVTGSFHATAFSLIFQKNFFVEVPSNVGSRIVDLLDTFDLRERIFSSEELSDDTDISWSKISNKMEELRQSSLRSLNNSIKAAVHV